MELLFLATMLGLLIWVTIFLLPSCPYSTRESLVISSTEKVPLSEVTVLIPARNEASTITKTLVALKAQDPQLKVILVDDQSTDNTIKYANSAKLDNLLILSGAKLPKGWSGKLWALEQGRKYVQTHYLVLVDADIILKPGLIKTILSKAKKNDIS